jgi:hypothetical protein
MMAQEVIDSWPTCPGTTSVYRGKSGHLSDDWTSPAVNAFGSTRSELQMEAHRQTVIASDNSVLVQSISVMVPLTVTPSSRGH